MLGLSRHSFLTAKASATAVNDGGLVTPYLSAKADDVGRGSSKLPFTRLGRGLAGRSASLITRILQRHFHSIRSLGPLS